METWIGKIVTFKGKEQRYVILNMISHENMASTCYDRDYYIIRYEDLLEIQSLTEEQLTKHSKVLKISVSPNSEYISIPFDEVSDVAPFEIRRAVTYYFRQMEAQTKTITVYK